MKKIVSITLSLLLGLALLTACGGNKLPEGMDAAEVETQAKAVLDAMNARDYEKLASLYTGWESIEQVPPTVEEWAASIDPLLDQVGPFEEYKKVSLATVEDDAFGTYAVAVVETKYEKQTVPWRVSFTPDMEVIGLRA